LLGQDEQMTRGFAAIQWVLSVVASLSLAVSSAHALGVEPKGGETVTQYLTRPILEAIFPGADRVGEVDGSPPAAAVYRGGQEIGFIFSTWDVTRSTGFSNRPVVLIVGIDLAGHIAAARLVHHTEPIGILGLKDEQLHAFVENYRGHDLKLGVDVVTELSSSVLGVQKFSQRAAPTASPVTQVDAVSRATTSSVLISDAIVRGARVVARSRGLLATPGDKPRLDVDHFAPATWPELEASGAIGHLRLSYRDVRGRLSGGLGNPGAAPQDTFLDLYVALVSVAGIGINVLGPAWYGQYTVGRGIDDHVVLIAANSPTSILGPDWEHADTIVPVEFVQGERTIRLSPKQIKSLPFLHASKAPELTERVLVFFSGTGELDPAEPFTLRLLLGSPQAGAQPIFTSYDLAYRISKPYLIRPVRAAEQSIDRAASGGADLLRRWSGQHTKILILAGGLAALTVILLMQDHIARSRRLHRVLRTAFLAWTLIWLGWYAGAQLTVVNIITYIHTLTSDRSFAYVLADPLVLILSLFTIAGLFVWGRAVFCGWLCPFGALQELVNNIGRLLRIPQLTIAPKLNSRLIAAKYLIFAGLVVASFVSFDLAMAGAEVEPFKAAIILRFMTEWPMVTYAAALIVAGLFVERFYCRFVCPLGGGLAILGRVRLMSWLKRHPQCGSPCRLCESVCPVGAIKRSGIIDMNECFLCLDCQVTYYDDHVCPPMVWRRRQRERTGIAEAVP
jgi:NosR/NirI family transcriptional regulator, nitrous oxide reductase regulator